MPVMGYYGGRGVRLRVCVCVCRQGVTDCHGLKACSVVRLRAVFKLEQQHSSCVGVPAEGGGVAMEKRQSHPKRAS